MSNREIKFRAWYENRMWWDVGLIPCRVILWDWDSPMRPEDKGRDPFYCEVKTIVPNSHATIGNKLLPPVMQYTGIKDKNGKEIYEGDICRLKMRDAIEAMYLGEGTFDIFRVEWISGMWQATFTDINESLFDLSEDGQAGADVEVIGNIYENQELFHVEG
jgi:hypothetical protein